MRLHEFTTPRAVPRHSCAISPGKHCPLFGAGGVLRGVSGITLLYLGTQDCVYYAQKMALEQRLSSPANPDLSRVLAIQLSDADLIFGIRPQLEALLSEEAQRHDIKGIFLVTSCSVEVLSEDLQAVVDTVQRQTNKKIQLISTENFKTFSYFDGMEAALSALVQGLKPIPRQEKSFAVVGVRHTGAAQSEPVRVLQANGYTLQSILPYDTSLDRIEALPGVSLILVLDGTGISVAKALETQFGIPYVRFDEKLNLEKIILGWRTVAELTGLPLDAWISEQHIQILSLSQQVRALVTGQTFFYSQVILYPFETCLFLAQLGMIPTCLFLGSVMDHTDDARLALSRFADPILLQNASNDAISAYLPEQAPDYLIGSAGRFIQDYPISQVNFRTIPVNAGFAFYRNCLNQLLDAAQRRERGDFHASF